MGKTICVVNQKGGVGKTTTAINLSAYLAAEGHPTLLVDMDPQGNASSGLGFQRPRKTIYEVLLGDYTLSSTIVKTNVEKLDLVPSDIRLSGAELELASMERRESRARAALETVRDQYDFILIDCPPSLNMLTVNALTAAQSVIIPVQCEYYALEGLTTLMQTIQRVQRGLNTGLQVEGIVMTMLTSNTKLGQEVVEDVRRHYGEYIFETVIPRNVKLGEAPSFCQPVSTYAPTSTGAEKYHALAQELLKKNHMLD